MLFGSLMMSLIMSHDGVIYKNSKYCQKLLLKQQHAVRQLIRTKIAFYLEHFGSKCLGWYILPVILNNVLFLFMSKSLAAALMTVGSLQRLHHIRLNPITFCWMHFKSSCSTSSSLWKYMKKIEKQRNGRELFVYGSRLLDFSTSNYFNQGP